MILMTSPVIVILQGQAWQTNPQFLFISAAFRAVAVKGDTFRITLVIVSLTNQNSKGITPVEYVKTESIQLVKDPVSGVYSHAIVAVSPDKYDGMLANSPPRPAITSGVIRVSDGIRRGSDPHPYTWIFPPSTVMETPFSVPTVSPTGEASEVGIDELIPTWANAGNGRIDKGVASQMFPNDAEPLYFVGYVSRACSFKYDRIDIYETDITKKYVGLEKICVPAQIGGVSGEGGFALTSGTGWRDVRSFAPKAEKGGVVATDWIFQPDTTNFNDCYPGFSYYLQSRFSPFTPFFPGDAGVINLPVRVLRKTVWQYQCEQGGGGKSISFFNHENYVPLEPTESGYGSWSEVQLIFAPESSLWLSTMFPGIPDGSFKWPVSPVFGGGLPCSVVCGVLLSIVAPCIAERVHFK